MSPYSRRFTNEVQSDIYRRWLFHKVNGKTKKFFAKRMGISYVQLLSIIRKEERKK